MRQRSDRPNCNLIATYQKTTPTRRRSLPAILGDRFAATNVVATKKCKKHQDDHECLKQILDPFLCLFVLLVATDAISGKCYHG